MRSGSINANASSGGARPSSRTVRTRLKQTGAGNDHGSRTVRISGPVSEFSGASVLIREAPLLVEHAGELVDVGQRVGSALKADRKVSAADRYDELQEVSIGHGEPTQPAAIDVAALGCQFQQRRVHHQLFVFVRLRRGCVFQSW